ncbi:MAG: hypothetical protein ACTHK7_08660 [Aureliella sp.]
MTDWTNAWETFGIHPELGLAVLLVAGALALLLRPGDMRRRRYDDDGFQSSDSYDGQEGFFHYESPFLSSSRDE